MNKFLKKFNVAAKSFLADDEGAQVVEYALIIAVVSIALVLALGALTPGLFTDFITRVQNCLAGRGCAAIPLPAP